MKKKLRLFFLFAFLIMFVRLSYGQTIPVTYFGMNPNQSGSGGYTPSILRGCDRNWDIAPHLTWGGTTGSDGIMTGATTFVWTNLDTQLNQEAIHGEFCDLMVLGRTPTFASSMYSVSHGITCHTFTGSCDPPTGLNLNGTGTPQFFIDWVAALVAHTHQPGYIAGTGTWAGQPHADLMILETWNEPDSQEYFTGSYDQLASLEWDARCISKLTTGTNPLSGQTCLQIRTAVTHGAGSPVVDTNIFTTFPTNPLNAATGIVLMPSFHAPGGGTNSPLNIARAFMACNGPATGWHAPNQSCTGGTAGWDGSDGLNMHMKYLNNWPTELEPTVDLWVGTNLNGLFASAGVSSKPIYGTEGGPSGFNPPWQGGPYTTTAGTYQQSYVARYWIYTWCKTLTGVGFPLNIWYNIKNGTLGGGTTSAGTASTQVYNWMVNNTMTACANPSGSTYTADFTGPAGYKARAVWNVGSNISYTVPAGYTKYKDLNGGSTTISGSTVTIGYSPILLTGSTTGPSAAFAPTSLNFGSIATGVTSSPLTTVLTNSGTSSLTISSIAITSGGTVFASPSTTCGGTLTAGSSCNVNVTCNPTSNTSFSGVLTATDNSGGVGGSTQTVSLSCSGISTASTSFFPTSLSFGFQSVGIVSAPKTVQLTNTGGTAFTVSSVALTTGLEYNITSNTCSGSLAAGASCVVTLTFKPTASQIWNDTISFTDTAPGSPQLILVSGTGLAGGQPQTQDVGVP